MATETQAETFLYFFPVFFIQIVAVKQLYNK